MSLEVKKLCEALAADKHKLQGLVIVAYGADGTTLVDIAGLPKENVRLFLHGLAVLQSYASGMPIQQVAELKDEPSPLIVLPGKDWAS